MTNIKHSLWAKPVPLRCPPVCVPGDVSMYSSWKYVPLNVQLQRLPPRGTQHLYVRRNNTWAQVWPPDLHMLQAASRAEGKEMTRRKQWRTSFHECTLVVSWGKKKKQQTKQKFMTEIRLIWSLHWQKNMPFLLVVVVPFRSFWFVLLNCWVWSFPIIRAIPKHSYALCLCMWVLSPIPQRERHF